MQYIATQKRSFTIGFQKTQQCDIGDIVNFNIDCTGTNIPKYIQYCQRLGWIKIVGEVEVNVPEIIQEQEQAAVEPVVQEESLNLEVIQEQEQQLEEVKAGKPKKAKNNKNSD